MSLINKMHFFCNGCASVVTERPTQIIGRKWKVCSMECYNKLEMAECAAILGQYPKLSREEFWHRAHRLSPNPRIESDKDE